MSATGAEASTGALNGTVLDAQGQAVAGAQVQLSAFATSKSGVQEAYLASATSDASGQYSFSAPSASQTAALAGFDGGTYNYEIDVTYVSNGSVQSATTTLPADAAFGAATAAARSAANVPASGRVKLSLAPLRTPAGTPVKAGGIRSRRDCTNNYATWKTVSTGTYQVITGEPHAYIGMNVQYSYQQDATTTIGLALTANGGGSWNESGSVSTTNTTGVGFTTPYSPIHYAQYIYETFVYAKQQESFNCTGASDNYRIVPQYWTGGEQASGNLTAYDGGSSPIWKYDQAHGGAGEANIDPGVIWHKTGGTGATYSAGAKFAGIELSANTKYSSAVTYTWKMDTNKSIPHYLFGANGVYPATGGGATIVYSN